MTTESRKALIHRVGDSLNDVKSRLDRLHVNSKERGHFPARSGDMAEVTQALSKTIEQLLLLTMLFEVVE